MSLVERALTDEPVLATLGPQDPVGVLALDGERRRLETSFFTRAHLDHFALEAAVVGPALVHAEKHLGEILSVGPAHVGLKGHDRVAGVVLT